MIFDYSDYRAFLKQTVIDRRTKNSSYSLRAMAQQLQLAPSTFSEVINGKKNLSPEMASQVALKLGLKSREADYFCLLAQVEGTKNESYKDALLKKIKNLNPRRSFHNLAVDSFKVISEWYHLGILACLALDNFEFSPYNLANFFGISRIESQAAIERLVRLGLIKKNETGYKETESDVLIASTISNESLNAYHKQMLSKAAASIEGQSFEERLFRTENIVIDKDQVREADMIIEEFFLKMARLTKQAKKKSKVYHLGTHFFNLGPVKRRARS